MVIGIDPKVDYAFKRVFGRDHPVNHRLLISLLEAVLRLPPDARITAVQLRNPFHEKEALDDRLAIVDIKATDQKGRQFTVEMQMLLHPFLPERLLYYWARLYPQPLTTGTDYEALRPTYVICFLNDELWEDHPNQYHWRFQLRDEHQRGILLTPDLEIHVLELPKFQRTAEELGEPLDQWLYFRRHAEELDLEHLPQRLETPEVRVALEELTILSKDQLEKERYEARLRLQMDESIRQKAARLWEEAGYKKGLDQGHKEGRKEALIEMIQGFQREFNREATPAEQLQLLSQEQLWSLLDQLGREVFALPPPERSFLPAIAPFPRQSARRNGPAFYNYQGTDNGPSAALPLRARPPWRNP